ncbi:hypothetical protein F5Y12DRAFT_799440 [Xylaria sp. FL1777]|nr:hypothetical protein F5Y12DRAFT_799440 [Xylaria sp. FL1777]
MAESHSFIHSEKVFDWQLSNFLSTNSPICNHSTCNDALGPITKVFRCVECGENYCENCWKRIEAHKKSVPNHRQSDPRLANLLNDILRQQRSKEELQKVHQKDSQTLWFGISEDNGKQFIHEGSIYEDLIFESPTVQPWGISPSLITFVGETGAGKSALIKLLIDVGLWTAEEFPGSSHGLYASSTFGAPIQPRSTPIVGSIDDEQTPTSADVHLYADPRTLSANESGNYPMLYADCEGLKGGEQNPIAIQSGSKHLNLEGNAEQLKKKIRPFLDGVDGFIPKEITWADDERQVIVESLYPRLLYSFSDVVVFVLDNPRKFEQVVISLVDWAHQAIEKSCNQSNLPHAVIALNKATQTMDDDKRWDADSVTNTIITSVDKALTKNRNLKRKVLFWAERSVEIHTVKELLECYYASVKAIRLPMLQYPELLEQQVSKLYDIISVKSRTSQERRRQHRMQLDAVKLHLYLRNAFHHFAKNKEEPFNFVKASFDINPVSPSFGLRNGILQLAVTVQPLLADHSGQDLWRSISRVIASCSMLNAYRRNIKGLGDPDSIFNQYWLHCMKALQEFYDVHWQCEYTSSKISRCVNLKNAHSKGHQSKGGYIEGGEWKCEASFENLQEQLKKHLLDEFKKIVPTFNLQQGNINREEGHLREVYKCHIRIINEVYCKFGDGLSLSSHSTCFSCLIECPEHVLPCGHIICTPCINAVGTLLGGGFTKLDRCLLKHWDETRGATPYLASIKPDQAGVRILTLDGGGVRGIVELTILQKIEEALDNKVPIQAFFDLIIGTSTGGIIALGLGHQGWSVSKCIHTFKRLANQAFTLHRGPSVIRDVATAISHGKYRTDPLEEAFKEAFSEDILFGSSTSAEGVRTKAAVVTTSLRGPVTLLGNYNRKSSEAQLYQFYRAESTKGEITAWESARATSAAPGYFKEFSHDLSEQVYLDGGIYHNNPIRIADAEVKQIWPQREYRHPDLLLSIGTGFHKDEIKVTSAPATKVYGGAFAFLKMVTQLGREIVKTSLACERAWKDWIATKLPPPEHAKRYARLNVPLDFEPQMDNVEELEKYADLASKHMEQEHEKIESIANQLVASCFYYRYDKRDLRKEEGGDGWKCSGSIECRLPPGDQISKNFGQLLWKLSEDIKKEGAPGLCFCVTERHVADFEDKDVHEIQENVIEGMRNSGKFEMPPFEISISSAIAETDILMALHMRKEGIIPIGGFPRNLLKDYPDTYRRKKRPQKRDGDSIPEDIMEPQSFRRMVGEAFATSTWGPSLLARTYKGRAGRRWIQTASTVGFNSEAESSDSDMDYDWNISLTDSSAEKVYVKRIQQHDEQPHQGGQAQEEGTDPPNGGGGEAANVAT